MRFFKIITCTTILLSLVTLCCCKGKPVSKNVMGASDVGIYPDEFYDSIHIVPLMMDSFNRFGMIKKIVSDGQFYYILDDTKKLILKYNLDGTPVKTLNKEGGSSNEYIEILDFCIDLEKKELSMMCMPPKIQTFDLDFGFKNVIELKKYCDRIYSYKGKIYLYSNPERELFYLKDGNLISILDESNIPSLNDSRTNVFHKLNNKLLYVAECTDQIYEIKDDQAIKYLDFTYPGEEKRIKGQKKNRLLKIDNYEEIVKNSPLQILSICESDSDYMIFYNHNLVLRCCMFNKKSKTIKKDGIFVGYGLIPQRNFKRKQIAGGSYGESFSYVDSLFSKKSFANQNMEDGLPIVIEYFPK
jgi:hypothetical protein